MKTVKFWELFTKSLLFTDSLITAIHNDISIASSELDKQEMSEFAKHNYFQDCNNQIKKVIKDVTADKLSNGIPTKTTET